MEQDNLGITRSPSYAVTLSSNGNLVIMATCSFKFKLILLLTISSMNLSKVGNFNTSFTCNETVRFKIAYKKDE